MKWLKKRKRKKKCAKKMELMQSGRYTFTTNAKKSGKIKEVNFISF